MRQTLAVLLWLLPAIALAQDFTTFKGHGGPIMGLAVSEDGQLASASFDNAVGLWRDGTPAWLEGHEAAVIAVVFAGAGGILSGGDDFSVRYWDVQEPSPRVLGRHTAKVTGFAVSPDGARAVSTSWDGTLQVWSLPPSSDGPGAPKRVLTGHKQGVNAAAFGPGNALFSASTDGTIRLWDLTDGTSRVIVKHGFAINQLVVDPAGDWLAYGAVDGVTRIIDLATEKELRDLSLDRRPILAMAHHAASGQLAVGDGEGYIMMISTADWRITHDFRAARQGPVWALAFPPDGETIYAGGLDDAIYAWPVDLLDRFDAAIDGERSFLRDVETMSNGERQFMRKCSICHALEDGPSRKAGPTLYGVFGRAAGAVPGYRYSDTLDGSAIIWDDETIDALFDIGPDHYIPGSKMPMQVIAKPSDRADLIAYLKEATTGN
ncbi:MAG: c-type cytochrome [Pseudomonadota bacterium]